MYSKIKTVQFDTITLENGQRYRSADAQEQGKIFYFRPGDNVEVNGGSNDTTLRSNGREIKVRRA